MKILAFDTSGACFSAAIVIDGQTAASETSVKKETHAKHIMPAIENLFSLSGLFPCDIDIIAVTRGPGSFTGLRIGLGVAKGIGMAAGIPLAGISTLDALAWPLRNSGQEVYVLVDARRSEVYFSRYVFKNGKLAEKTEEKVCRPEHAVTGAEDNAIFCASGAYVYMDKIEECLGRKIRTVNNESVINASDIAMITEYEPSWCLRSDASGLLPIYIRRPEAEINYEMLNRAV